MKWTPLSSLLLIAAILPVTLTYRTFQGYIPNGLNVPHPCKDQGMWAGVGHVKPGGATEDLNPFGHDFRDNDNKWDPTLCEMDSDGDGMTNGQELGDPDCTWSIGQDPSKTEGISHPGYCDPEPSNNYCEDRYTFDCGEEKKDEEMDCGYMDHTDVQHMDLRFKETTVPSTETNYYCQSFELPDDKDYHLIGFEPLIDNKDLVHHMVLYGCPAEETRHFESPDVCGMNGDNGDKCQNMMTVWSLGMDRICYGNNTGFLFGQSGHQLVKLEIHWNNPFYLENEKDSSGLRVFYQTARPEVKNLATFVVGQSLLAIPPGHSRHTEVGVCGANCTGYFFQEPMYVTAGFNHMHGLGTAMKVEIYRDGELFKVLTNDEDYDYNSPKFYRYDPPVELLPRDVIKTICMYDSMSKDTTTYFGEATSDEMCYAFLVMYPSSAFPSEPNCAAHGPLDMCALTSGQPYQGCDWMKFIDLSKPESTKRYMDVMSSCREDDQCTDDCYRVVQEIKMHPCMGAQMERVVRWLFGTYKEGRDFVQRLDSCLNYEDDHHDDHHDDHDHGSMSGALSSTTSTTISLTMLVALATGVKAIITDRLG